MTFEELFRKALARVEEEKIRYALAGGLAVSVYSKEIRTTNDVNLLLWAESKTKEIAERIITAFGLTASIVRKADLEGGPLFAIKRKSTPPYIVVGRKPGDTKEPGLDFILPEMPWFHSALDRAQKNRIDFGIAKIPTLTVEDVIIAKFYSASKDAKRFNDLNDLKSILEAGHQLDFSYLAAQMKALAIRVPRLIEDLVPAELRKISKSIRKKC